MIVCLYLIGQTCQKMTAIFSWFLKLVQNPRQTGPVFTKRAISTLSLNKDQSGHQCRWLKVKISGKQQFYLIYFPAEFHLQLWLVILYFGEWKVKISRMYQYKRWLIIFESEIQRKSDEPKPKRNIAFPAEFSTVESEGLPWPVI